MQLHMRGVELVVELLESAERVESISQDDLKRLLKEASDVVARLIERDVPPERREQA